MKAYDVMKRRNSDDIKKVIQDLGSSKTRKDNDTVKGLASLLIETDENGKEKPFRNWCFVNYADSAPENWLDILTELHIPAFVSPFHDSDVDIMGDSDHPDQPKPAHFHVMLMFEGKKARSSVVKIAHALGAKNDVVYRVNSLRGMARYLCHMDNPEKHQYDPDDVMCFAGADYMGAVELPQDTDNVLGEMMDFVTQECVYSFSVFARYCHEHHMDWFRVLSRKATLFMKEYIKGLAWEQNNQMQSLDLARPDLVYLGNENDVE